MVRLRILTAVGRARELITCQCFLCLNAPSIQWETTGLLWGERSQTSLGKVLPSMVEQGELQHFKKEVLSQLKQQVSELGGKCYSKYLCFNFCFSCDLFFDRFILQSRGIAVLWLLRSEYQTFWRTTYKENLKITVKLVFYIPASSRSVLVSCLNLNPLPTIHQSGGFEWLNWI